MSDGENDNELPDVKPESNGHDEASPAAPDAQLVITMMKGGQVNVSYPSHEMVCRYLMDKARSILDDEWRQKNAPMIQTPNGNLGKAGLLRRMRG